MSEIQINIVVKGRVQGVAFRYYTCQRAMEIGLSGIVKNRSDGSVYIEAVGEEEKINQLLEWCREGSPASRVDEINSHIGEQINHKGRFTIIR
jgi:acylphosphatase